MTSDPGFRAARKAGAQGAFRLFLPPLFLLGFLVVLAGPFSSGEGSGRSTPFLVVAVIVAVIVLLIFATRARRWSRNRNAWSRAARGAVSLTLRGEAVAAERTVSGRPMRTVVVEHRGNRQYLHLLFAPGAPVQIMGPGWVTVEFFAGDDAEGPARLLLADGRTLWAYSARLGAAAGQPRSRTQRSSDTMVGTTDDGAGAAVPAVVPGLHGGDRGRGEDRPGDPDPSPSATEHGGASSSSAGSSTAAASGAAASGAAASSAVWAGGDGWTGGSSWGADPTWTGSAGGSGGGGSGSDGGGGWFSGGDSGGWGGGDSGGGGGDSGGGGGD